MADERYEWLDKDAAERLLRGEPVDPVGGQSCTDAERLVAALDAAARAARPAAGELPGEAAALAAFRTATHAARTRTRTNAQVKGGAKKAGGPAGAELPEPVRIAAASVGSVSSAAPGRLRASRWSRPVRFGLVASLAGCALGGVAVAAGTGMLSGPFGGHTPLPASSVSAEATPEELGSGLTEEEAPKSAPPASPGTGTSPPPADPSAPAGDPARGGSGRAKKDGGGERRPGGAETGSAGRPENGELPENSGNDGSGAWYAKAFKACRDYRDGKLNDAQRRKLEALAKGAHNLDLFCDRVIEGSGRNQNGQNDTDEDGGADEQGDGASNANSGSGSGAPSSARFASGVRPPSTPASLVPSARTAG
ncbi:hypothetical protein ACH4CE_07755 [Streptomyces gelaticus]|uniref:hypothetical protein n=1 Tax=Streptomyces gelaticus TaxID=285446 RepID=UPI0037A5AE21